jgi:hypothetical protein
MGGENLKPFSSLLGPQKITKSEIIPISEVNFVLKPKKNEIQEKLMPPLTTCQVP